MSLILSKSGALAMRTIGRGKFGICRILIPPAYNSAPLSKNSDGPISINIVWPAHGNARKLSSSTPAVKTSVQVHKLNDIEHHTVEETPKPSKYKAAINHEHLVSSLIKCSSVRKQIEEMVLQLHMDEEEKVARLALSKELEEILSPYFPNCSVILVGSSISGFGLKGCDIDFALQTNWDPSMRNPKLMKDKLPLVKDIDDGTVPVSRIGEFSPQNQLRFVRRVLTAHWEHYRSPMSFLAGRCPILNFAYGPKQVNCDLSFENSSAVLSTKILLFCGKMDERIIPLYKMINYWAKHADLVGSVDKFKSYAFALLLIYFLQTRKPPILPPLKCILQETNFFKDDGLWDADLSQDLSKFPKSTNEQTIEELLKEFFFFYLFFDFSRTICPLDGCSVTKSAINQDTESTAPKICLGSSICIQDPLDKVWNVTTGVSFKYCISFVKELLAVCKIYQDPIVWMPSSNKWGLAAIIDQAFSKDTIKEDLLEVPIAKCVVAGCSEESINLWKLKTIEAVLKILSYALLFKCDVTRRNHVVIKDSGLRSLRNCDGGDIVDFSNTKTAHTHKQNISVETLLIAKCSTTANTWQGRSNWTENYFPSDVVRNPLELEHAISLKLFEDASDKEKRRTNFIFQCTEQEVNGTLFLNAVFSPSESSRFPLKGMVFLKEFIPSLIKKICI